MDPHNAPSFFVGWGQHAAAADKQAVRPPWSRAGHFPSFGPQTGKSNLRQFGAQLHKTNALTLNDTKDRAVPCCQCEPRANRARTRTLRGREAAALTPARQRADTTRRSRDGSGEALENTFAARSSKCVARDVC